jgi:DNA-binding response OmpR family regulator
MSKVIVVDDDQTMISLLQTLLELDGYNVVKAGSVEAFFKKLEPEAPDLVLLDVFLEDGEGLDVLKKIRNHQNASIAQLPVVMTSGMELSSKCREAGANDFLLKPYDPEHLLDIIKANLKGAKAA